MRRFYFTLGFFAAALGLALTNSAAVISSVDLNFNATAIPADGRYVWFNSAFTPSGVPTTGLTHLYITNASLNISTDGIVPVPNAIITFDPSLNAATSGSASVNFNSATNTWEELLPVNGLPGTRFLDGVPWLVTSPAGNADVTWTMSFASDRPISLNWQAAAAVYPTFSGNPGALNVKPVDSNTASIYLNSDHSGTPEAFKTFVVGGATGGGGSNFTGSYSPTVSVTPEVLVPEPASLALLVPGLLVLASRKRRSAKSR